MKSATNYARIINFLNTSKSVGIEEGCEEVLAFIVSRQDQGVPTMITHLVQSLQFGTGPTVHRKVSQLGEAGLIKLVRSPNDGRAKHLELSAKGIKHLSDQYKKIQNVLKQQ
jgi:hypothetical protein